jgi:inorganic pyrophosphatase
LDHHLGRIRLDRTLFTATPYPADYGFVPDAQAEDGDPLDALVLVLEPTFPGCQIQVRPVGVFAMHDEHGPDAGLLCMPAHDPRRGQIQDLPDLPEHVLSEIGHFFDVYKELEPSKQTQVLGWRDRCEAEKVLSTARDRFTEATRSVADRD